VRILLDECVPQPLGRELSDHEVLSVAEMGWSGKRNGELLSLAASQGFDVFLTVDQNLRYQQTLRSGGIGVVVLKARTNRLADLIPLVPDLRELLVRVRPGELHEVRWKG
jgi:hypothetical protein